MKEPRRVRQFGQYKERVVGLRRKGLSYSEIEAELGVPIPKSTLSLWCQSVPLLREAKDRLLVLEKRGWEKAREVSRLLKLQQKADKLALLKKSVQLELLGASKEMATAKLCLAMLYLGEGVKGIIELPAIFTNILSYLRLGAVGLASVYLAIVINENFAVPMLEEGGIMILLSLIIS